MAELERKIPQILKIFKNRIKDLKVITSGFAVIGFLYKDYCIKTKGMYKIEKNFKTSSKNVFTAGGLVIDKLKTTKNLKKHFRAKNTNKLRKYFYQQRQEVWQIIREDESASDFISIDFNHHYLKQMCKSYPLNVEMDIKTINIKRPGFYYIRFYTDKNIEPSLPT